MMNFNLWFKFRKNVKEPFTGDNREFNYELDIGNIAPSLLQYVSESGREWMEEWVININYNGIINLIRTQQINKNAVVQQCF
ncbi:uncharacterized protein OCT59_001287 [Rhizophagus irregularis]|uniref:uncharacterized protein n=1 Tax=Rhizophagus irregularis TaxID=588596 RepID=UPI003324A8CC|nr:hypothetical protein OCT59_001287 [Rhizophagus irregularis]